MSTKKNARTYKTTKGTELPLLDMSGREYLEVKYRVVWFREEKPDWRIEVDIVHLDENKAVSRAIIRNEAGHIMSTAVKCETRAGFPDFLEKSETGAIGRALALVGFGTQFCADELDEGKRIVDSPVVPKKSGENRPIVARTPNAMRNRSVSIANAPECCGQPMKKSFKYAGKLYCEACKQFQPAKEA